MTDLVRTTTASFGADRDWLLRFCPPHSAQALNALFDVENEVMASLRDGLEHSVAHARLEWWTDELNRLAQGSPRHPAARTLATYALEHGTTPPDLTALVEHVRVDLACVAFLSRSELDDHLGSWSRSIFRAAALIGAVAHSSDDRVNTDRPSVERLAVNAGSLVRELELLRDFSSHAIAGRIYLPLGDPPEPHAPWATRPLGEKETRALTSRREAIGLQLKQFAAETPPSMRPMLRIPMLWMCFALARHRSDSALLSPLRRTIAAWRGALALSRGRLPTELL